MSLRPAHHEADMLHRNLSGLRRAIVSINDPRGVVHAAVPGLQGPAAIPIVAPSSAETRDRRDRRVFGLRIARGRPRGHRPVLPNCRRPRRWARPRERGVRRTGSHKIAGPHPGSWGRTQRSRSRLVGNLIALPYLAMPITPSPVGRSSTGAMTRAPRPTRRSSHQDSTRVARR
jgi:hypothetical protein